MTEQELIEQLADKEHASWARWMQYLFSQCNKDLDWNMTISGSLVKRWMRQIETPYTELSEREKQSDRDEVAHILPIIEQYKAQFTQREDGLDIALKFTLDECKSVKSACEAILGRDVTWEEVAFQIALRCKLDLGLFVRTVFSQPH